MTAKNRSERNFIDTDKQAEAPQVVNVAVENGKEEEKLEHYSNYYQVAEDGTVFLEPNLALEQLNERAVLQSEEGSDSANIVLSYPELLEVIHSTEIESFDDSDQELVKLLASYLESSRAKAYSMSPEEEELSTNTTLMGIW